MDRKLNVLFSFAGVFVFILTAGSAASFWGIGLGLVLSFLCSFLAFASEQLTLDGLVAATIAGTIIFGIGGWAAALIVLFFFLSSTVLSDVNTKSAGGKVRRDGRQVWANGFWMVLCLFLYKLTQEPAFLAGALSAVAVATADTWATELRSSRSDSTFLITTFEPVAPGTDGGVSLQGTIWAVVGSAFIATLSALFFLLPLSFFFCIFIAGFLGCLLDSYLGAALQRDGRSVNLPAARNRIMIDNNIVNAIATGAGALLGLILKIIIV